MKRRDLIVGILLAIVLAAGLGHAWLADPAGGAPAVALDITSADGSVIVDGARVGISVEPRPARPFQPLRFRFDVEPPVESARVSFTMTMDMGEHAYTLVPGDGAWTAAGVVLPTCGSGSREWFGDLELRGAAGVTRRVRFRIELAPVE